jgi:hypothetical protein
MKKTQWLNSENNIFNSENRIACRNLVIFHSILGFALFAWLVVEQIQEGKWWPAALFKSLHGMLS